MTGSLSSLELKLKMQSIEINESNICEELHRITSPLVTKVFKIKMTNEQRPMTTASPKLGNESCVIEPKVMNEFLDFVEHQDMVRKVQALFKESEKKKETIVNLPLEYTCWCFGDWEHSLHEDGKILRVIAVLDMSTSQPVTQMISLGYKTDMSYEEQAMLLFYHACFHPVRKCQRRPYYVTCLNTLEIRGAVLNLAEFGVNFFDSEASVDLEWNTLSQESPLWLRRCFNCGLRATPDLFIPCCQCQAVLYCSQECQMDSWNHQHKKWCRKFKNYMKMEHELAELPFTFCQISTRQSFSCQRFKSFLQEHELYNKGLWRRECPATGGADAGVAFGELLSPQRPYALPLESAVLESASLDKKAPFFDSPLLDWKAYYSYRGFWLDSPIAGLLHYPLTLYWIIVHCLPQHYKTVFKKVKLSNKLQVHIIGAEKEAEMFDPFLECARLLAPVELNLHLFGDELSRNIHNKCQSQENLTFQVHCGLYHEFTLNEFPVPDLVVGFNAGLSAYSTFIKTVKLILENKTPLYCTDYCSYSIVHSEKALSDSRMGRIVEPEINPFRSPFRLIAEELNLPRYSNAFVYCVKPWKLLLEDEDEDVLGT